MGDGCSHFPYRYSHVVTPVTVEIHNNCRTRTKSKENCCTVANQWDIFQREEILQQSIVPLNAQDNEWEEQCLFSSNDLFSQMGNIVLRLFLMAWRHLLKQRQLFLKNKNIYQSKENLTYTTHIQGASGFSSTVTAKWLHLIWNLMSLRPNN